MLRASARKQIIDILSLSKERDAKDYQQLARLTDELHINRLKDDEWSAKDSSELQALLAEYNSLRQESLEVTRSRLQISTVGIAAIGALMAGSLSIDNPSKNELLVFSLFSFAIPVTGSYVVLLWVSEAVRSNRIGHFLASESEAKINRLLGRMVLSWEASLWSGLQPRIERWSPSRIALGLIGIISLCSPVIGLSLVRPSLTMSSTLAIVVPLVIVGFAFFYTYKTRRHLARSPRIHSTSYPLS